MNFVYYNLYYTVIKNRKEKDNEEEQEKIVDDENDYINYNDFITPNHYIGIKNDNVMLWLRNLRSQTNQFKLFILHKKRQRNNE